MEQNTVAFVLAGGKGERLRPLTAHRAKPAVPLAAKYRIIDIPMSGLLYAGIRKIVVVPQWKSKSLTEHIQDGYTRRAGSDREIKTAPPREGVGEGFYEGTVAAVDYNRDSISKNTDHVLILAADHVTDFNIRKFLEAHHQGKRDLTVAVEKRVVNKRDFHKDQKTGRMKYNYGLLEFDSSFKITKFREKPFQDEMPEEGEVVYISMGDYAFERPNLTDALKRGYGKDFGTNVIPGMIADDRDVFAHVHDSYWRDVGTLDAFYRANMDFLLPSPPIDLYQMWIDGAPLLTKGSKIPPSIEEGKEKTNLVAEGVRKGKGITLEGSIISPGVIIGPGAEIVDSIIFDRVNIGAGAKIYRTIIDKDNTVVPQTRIGYDQKEDSRREYHVDRSAKLTVLEKVLDK